MYYDRDISQQIGCEYDYILEKNNPDLQDLLMTSNKNSHNKDSINGTFILKYLNLNFHSNNIKINDIYEAIINKTFKQWLVNNFSDKFQVIENNKEELSSYIYKKRFYSLMRIFVSISNISLLQFYKDNKEYVNEVIDKYRKYLDTNYNTNYYWSHSDDGENIKNYLNQLYDKFDTCDFNNIVVDKEFNSCVALALTDVIELLDTNNYVKDEFDTHFINVILSILLDHLITIDDRKSINNFFMEMHRIHNRKNENFYNVVYDKKIRSKKPILLFTNNPKLMYYYLNFYKVRFNGRLFKRLLKHNMLGIFLATIKNANNTNMDLSRYMNKFSTIFNKYKSQKIFNLDSYVQIDTILTTDKTNILLDILEQNMDITYKLFKESINSQKNHYRYYYRNNQLTWEMNSINIFDRLLEININNDETQNKFWNIIQSLLLNYKMKYNLKKEILSDLHEKNIAGFDEFAASAPMELQQLVCEVLLS